jgi:hypothetical protein
MFLPLEEPLTLTGTVSQKSHGLAGTFDLPLPISGAAGVEGRSGGDQGALTLVFAFNKPLTDANVTVTSGRGNVVQRTIDGDKLTVRLFGVRDRQTLELALTNVTDIHGGRTDVSFSVELLRGDVTGDGEVDEADRAPSRRQFRQAARSTRTTFART